MPLKYIIDEVSSEIGLTDLDLNPHKRTWLLRKINEAARRFYRKEDLPFQLKEIFVRITNAQTIVLPGFIGEIRAMRSQRWNDRWTLNDIRPRYTQADWVNKWNKARIVGESAIGVEMTNASILTFEYPEVDSTLIITATGETTNSNRRSENVTMTATSKNGTISFTDIQFLRKNKASTYNVTVKDIDDNTIAHIYADQLESKYLVVDISQYPNIQDCSDGTFVMEVLYKPQLPVLLNDEDAFPLVGYDDIIVKMTLQIIAEGEKGNEGRAILMQEQAAELVNEITQDKTGTVEKPMFTSPHGLYDLFPKYERL